MNHLALDRRTHYNLQILTSAHWSGNITPGGIVVSLGIRQKYKEENF